MTNGEDRQVDVVKLIANIICYGTNHIPAVTRDNYVYLCNNTKLCTDIHLHS